MVLVSRQQAGSFFSMSNERPYNDSSSVNVNSVVSRKAVPKVEKFTRRYKMFSLGFFAFSSRERTQQSLCRAERRACPSLPGGSRVPRVWHPCLSTSCLALRRQGAQRTLQFAGAVAFLTNRRSKATRRLR